MGGERVHKDEEKHWKTWRALRNQQNGFLSYQNQVKQKSQSNKSFFTKLAWFIEKPLIFCIRLMFLDDKIHKK